MGAVRGQTNVDRKLFVTVVGALIGLAWLSLWIWGQSPYARYLSHHSLNEVRGGGLLLLVFIAGWTLMIVAMMLPTSLPLVMMYYTVTRRRSNRPRLMVLLVVGYLVVWTLFGSVVYLGDFFLHELVERIAWLEANVWMLSAATLVLAGIYQFTLLKYYCLDKCRSPLSFITEHWRGRNEHVQALRLGMHHGLFCIGCCWSLMLLMFVVEVGNLGWMLVLGVVMAVEKNVPWGRRLSAPLGAALLTWGVVLLMPLVL